jgi:DNA-binding NarL/FixJ family response regulator
MILTTGTSSTYVDDVDRKQLSSLSREATNADPAIGLRAAAVLRKVAEQLELEHVRRARARGWSWREIALALNLTKQAVHHKYADLVDGGT